MGLDSVLREALCGEGRARGREVGKEIGVSGLQEQPERRSKDARHVIEIAFFLLCFMDTILDTHLMLGRSLHDADFYQ